MKTRILTAAVAIPALLLILLVADKVIAAVLWGALLAISAYELLYSTGLIRESRLVIYACVMAFAIALWSYFDAVRAFGILLVILYMAILFSLDWWYGSSSFLTGNHPYEWRLQHQFDESRIPRTICRKTSS